MTPWITDSWRNLLPAPWAEVVLAAVAVICGAIVGSEREKHEKAAGLRTLMLVCLGSCGYTMVAFTFSTNAGDISRVVAQIVTGIGFLGAGVIMHGRNTITGTTTAATIWATAAVGIFAGSGYCGGALGLTLLVRLVLSMIVVYETLVTGERKPMEVRVGYAPADGKTKVKIEWLLVDYRVSTIHAEWTVEEQDLHQLQLQLHLARHRLRQLLADIVSIPEVKSIEENFICRIPRHGKHRHDA